MYDGDCIRACKGGRAWWCTVVVVVVVVIGVGIEAAVGVGVGGSGCDDIGSRRLCEGFNTEFSGDL